MFVLSPTGNGHFTMTSTYCFLL